MPVRRPQHQQRSRQPRRNLLKCGFKRPPARGGHQFPAAVPYIVTRYIGLDGSPAVIEDCEKGAVTVPCRIVGNSTVGSFHEFYVEAESAADHQRRRSQYESPDDEPDVVAWAPWTFRIPTGEKRMIQDFQDIQHPVTVIRLPEVEVARPMRGLPAYGVNPSRVSIQLAMDEAPLSERLAFEERNGYEPDFNCFTEHFQLWDNAANAPFCKGDGCMASRLNKETNQRDEVACVPWIKNEDGRPNHHVCSFRGKWNGSDFVKPRNPCKFSSQFAFRVAGVPTLWLYQVFTTSETTAGNIRPMLNAVLGFKRDGKVTGFPMVLSVINKTFTPTVEGKQIKTTKPVWQLDADGQVLRRIDRASIANHLDGPSLNQVSLPAPPADQMDLTGEDLSEFHPDEHAQEEAERYEESSWEDQMLADNEVLGLFRQLQYRKKDATTLFAAIEKKHGDRSHAAKRDFLVAGLKKKVEAQSQPAPPRPEPEPKPTQGPQQQGEVIDASFEDVTVQSASGGPTGGSSPVDEKGAEMKNAEMFL